MPDSSNAHDPLNKLLDERSAAHSLSPAEREALFGAVLSRSEPELLRLRDRAHAASEERLRFTQLARRRAIAAAALIGVAAGLAWFTQRPSNEGIPVVADDGASGSGDFAGEVAGDVAVDELPQPTDAEYLLTAILIGPDAHDAGHDPLPEWTDTFDATSDSIYLEVTRVASAAGLGVGGRTPESLGGHR